MKKKKIKITTSCSGFNFSFQQGQTYDVEDYIADDLIAVGYAEAIIEKKPGPTVEDEKTDPEVKPTEAVINEKLESTVEDEKTDPEVKPTEAVINENPEPTVEDEKAAPEVKPTKTRKTSKKGVSENAGA